MSNLVEYRDTVAVHPGYYINEIVEDSGLTQQDFARRLGTTPKNLSILIRGEQSLSIDIAVKLSRMLGTTIGFWLNLQKAYDEKIAEMRSEEELIREREVFRLMDYRFFRDSFGLPKHERKKDEQIKSMREFLGVASLTVLEQSNLAARIRNYSEKLSKRAVVNANAMTQIAVNQALEMNLPRYNKQRFEKAVSFLESKADGDAEFISTARKTFENAGVALILLPCVKDAGIVAVSKKLEGKMLLMMNEQMQSPDRFCYTLFRETEHIKNGEPGITLGDGTVYEAG